MEPEYIPPGSEISFRCILPVDGETCQGHIVDNLSRNIPEAISRKSLTIIANGPSARNVDLRAIKGHTLAVNGALGLFLEQGVTPHYWAACDAQEAVKDFLPSDPPKDIMYLVASKCHPAVFNRLRDRHVQTWHLKDHQIDGKARIALASSITICATWLMHRMGYTDFEYWGWDGCFMEGRHHAAGNGDWSAVPTINITYGGALRDGDVVGGRTFTSTRTWAVEARDAEQFFQLAEYFDIGVKVNGDGMFKCARESILSAA